MTKNHKARIFLAVLAFFMICNTPYNHTNAQETNNLVKKIVLDAGHGGKDPGAIGKRTKEKNLTLAITLKLGKYIEEKIPGVEVVYTRTTDKFLELKTRTDIAIEENADVFISIHINSCKDKNVKGVCTYVTGLARSQENLELAMLENSVIKNEETTRQNTATFSIKPSTTKVNILHPRYFKMFITNRVYVLLDIFKISLKPAPDAKILE